MGVVVVGAGIAGIACARRIAAAGHPVRVLEGAATVGGRMGCHHHEGRPADVGAAYFTVRDPEFARVVAGWRAAGLARPWTAELGVFAADEEAGRVPGPMRWSAPAGLCSLVTALADGLDVELDRTVTRVAPGPAVDGEPADVVVLAMPDPQAASLLDRVLPSSAQVEGRSWQPVLSVVLGYPRREWADLPAAFVNGHPVLTLVADDGARRGDGAPVLVAHSTGPFARRHGDRPDEALPEVAAAVGGLLGLRGEPVWTAVRYWPCAAPEAVRGRAFHLGADGVGLAGDGWGSPRIETAWRSGTALGRAVVARLGGVVAPGRPG